ncbi:MAG: TRL-like family protein [Planctomycetota bacterium JB042]
MKSKLASLALLAALPFSTGCLSVYSPAIGVVYTDVKFPSHVTGNGAPSKSATGEATSFFGIFAAGDASIDNIARKGGIESIHHVDTHVRNILGFGTMEVTVYGD